MDQRREKMEAWPRVLAALVEAGFGILLPRCPECKGRGFVNRIETGRGWRGSSSEICPECADGRYLMLPEAVARLPALEDVVRDGDGDSVVAYEGALLPKDRAAGAYDDLVLFGLDGGSSDEALEELFFR